MHPVDRSLPVDLVRIDAIYNPVRRANFTVAETRVGQRTDYDRLTVTVETNGTISPEDAMAYAAALAQEHFRYFVEFGKVPAAREPVAEAFRGRPEPARACWAGSSTTSASRCGRSTRSRIPTSARCSDLVAFTEDELLKVKNVGEKALAEIGELLRARGARTSAMQFEEVDGELRVRSKSERRRPPRPATGRRLMRHRAKGRQLSRTSEHRTALLSNMATSLFKHERIVTTEAKAKELRPYAERLITLARRGDLHARRLAEPKLQATASRSAASSPRSARASPSRPGGYTRILKLGHRPGDGADVARIELLAE